MPAAQGRNERKFPGYRREARQGVTVARELYKNRCSVRRRVLHRTAFIVFHDALLFQYSLTYSMQNRLSRQIVHLTR